MSCYATYGEAARVFSNFVVGGSKREFYTFQGSRQGGNFGILRVGGEQFRYLRCCHVQTSLFRFRSSPENVTPFPRIFV